MNAYSCLHLLPLCLSTLLPVLGQQDEFGASKVRGAVPPWSSPVPPSSGGVGLLAVTEANSSAVTLDPAAGVGMGDYNQCPVGQKHETCMYLEDLSPVRQSWVDDPAFLPTTIIYGFAFVLGITGNTLVIFALLGDRKAHNVTSSFLVSLALADLVFLIVCVPYDLGIKMKAHWAGGLALCKIFGFVEMLSAAASVLNLTAVSVER